MSPYKELWGGPWYQILKTLACQPLSIFCLLFRVLSVVELQKSSLSTCCYTYLSVYSLYDIIFLPSAIVPDTQDMLNKYILNANQRSEKTGSKS